MNDLFIERGYYKNYLRLLKLYKIYELNKFILFIKFVIWHKIGVLIKFYFQIYKTVFLYLFYIDRTVDITIEIKLLAVSNGIILIVKKWMEVLPNYQEEVPLEDRVVQDLEHLLLQLFPKWYHRPLLLYPIEKETLVREDQVLDAIPVLIYYLCNFNFNS